MNYSELHEASFVDGELHRSTFALLGVGPEPDIHEILPPIMEIYGATAVGTDPKSLEDVPDQDNILTLVTEEDEFAIHFWVGNTDEFVEQSTGLDTYVDKASLQMALNSDWALFVLCDFSPEVLLEQLNKQLRCVELLCSELVRQVFDLSANRLWTARQFRDVFSIPDYPPITDLYALHTVSPDEGPDESESPEPGVPELLWAHTCGLERFGLPNLEAFEVPADHMQHFRELMVSLVERLIDAPEMMGEIFAVDDVARAVLVEVEDIIAALPSNAAGVNPRFRESDHSLSGNRRALLGVYHDPENAEDVTHWDLTPLLENIQSTGKLYRSANNAARMKKLVKYRLPLLKSVWADHRDKDWRLLVKIPRIVAGAEQREHRWFEIQDLDGFEVSGWPVASFGGSKEEREPHQTIDLQELSAFVLLTPEGRWDAAQLPEFVRQLQVIQ